MSKLSRVYRKELRDRLYKLVNKKDKYGHVTKKSAKYEMSFKGESKHLCEWFQMLKCKQTIPRPKGFTKLRSTCSVKGCIAHYEALTAFDDILSMDVGDYINICAKITQTSKISTKIATGVTTPCHI